MASCKRSSQPNKATLFPEEVIEKIVSFLPFPSVLKARGLTQWWSSAFTSGPASSLQYHAKSASKNSTTYCPVYVCPEQRCFIGYNLATRKWRKMYNISYFSSQRKTRSYGFCTSSGSLICGAIDTHFATEIFMKNVITGSSRSTFLPIQPNGLDQRYLQVIGSGSGSFKILVYLYPWTLYHPQTHLQIYDSKRDTWFMLETDMPIPYFTYLKTPFRTFAGAAYHHYRLYVLYQDKMQSLGGLFAAQLMAYDLLMEEEPRCTKVRLDFPLLHFAEREIGGRPREIGMVVCCDELMVVVVSEAMTGNTIPAHCIAVYKLNLDAEDWITIAIGPPSAISGMSCSNFVVHEGSIYMGGCDLKGPTAFLVLDVLKDRWSYFTSPFFGGAFGQFFAFQPGLDPFVMI